MSRRQLLGLHAGFWLLVATELVYVLLGPSPPIWPGILIVAAALVVGLVLILNT